MRALAVLLALPAACQDQPQSSANAAPPVKASDTPARNDVQVAEEGIRNQLGNAPGLSFANGVAYHQGDLIVAVCGEVTRGGRTERYVAVAGRAAWLEAGMRPGEMARAIRDYCHNEGGTA